MSRKTWRILVPVHVDLVPPETIEGLSAEEIQPWKTEYDVITTLRQMGHEVVPLGLYDDLNVLREAIREHRPHIAFNLLEEFHGNALLDQHLVSYLELARLRYTGCNPKGLTLAHDKALTKKVLGYHGIHVPGFAVFPLRGRVDWPGNIGFPLFVKSLTEEGSVGISQASIVHDREKLMERVDFIHRQTGAAAIAEEYVEGREIYVGVMGNTRLRTLTPWELIISNLGPGSANIATDRVKWDYEYQDKAGVRTEAASLTASQKRQLGVLAKRIYRFLCLSGYARLDFRMDAAGRFYLLEANPNPNLSCGEDFSEAAEDMGIGYEELLRRVIVLGLSYRANGTS